MVYFKFQWSDELYILEFLMNNPEEITYKRWFITTITSLIAVLILIAVCNIIMDPYFHYHKPVTKYRLTEERYINDGIARHFDYDAIIIGNWLTQNFKASQFDELFDVNSIKLPYSGAGYMEIWQSLQRNLNYQNNTSLVLAGMDLEDLSKGPQWRRYGDYPEYLYDDNPINDVQYLFNKSVLYRGTFFNLIKTISGGKSTDFDEYSSWIRESGPEYACDALDQVSNDDKSYKRELTEGDLELIHDNVEINILPVLEENTTTTFMMIIPPSSIAKWAEYYNHSEIDWRLDGLQYALPMLLSYENVIIYAFDDEYDITTDLNHYSDNIHYDAGINEWMLNEISAGKHRITLDNYQDYIDEVRQFYNSYNYEELNQFINRK